MNQVTPPCSILFEDNHLLIVEKPINVLSQADDTGDTDLLTLLKDYIKVAYNKPGNVYLGLVHRLDRPVGGAMAFAKTSKSASRLSDQVRTRTIQKTYTAILRGTPTKSSDTLKHYLLKDTKTNTVQVVSSTTKDAKHAELSYNVLGSSDGLTCVQIYLHTGRPHQIRVQFAAIGCPLYGDQKYGAQHNKPGQQLALWATQLELQHPVSKEQMVFKSIPPQVLPWTTFQI